ERSICGAQDDESTTTSGGCRRHRAGRRLLAARARDYSSRAGAGRPGIRHQQFGRHNYTAKYESDLALGHAFISKSHFILAGLQPGGPGGTMKERTLTLALMDPPYESANSTTAFRIIYAALEQGINVNVFAYEGAVCLALKDQTPHANPVKGTSVDDEEHPTTKAFVSSLVAEGAERPRLTWVN